MARATSVLMLGGLLAVPIGMGLAGPVADALGTRAVLDGVAVIAVLVTVGTLAVPATWRVGTAPAADPALTVSSSTSVEPLEAPTAGARKPVATAAGRGAGQTG